HPDEPRNRRVRYARGVRSPHLAPPARHGERMKGETTMATRPARGGEAPAAVEHRFFEVIPPGATSAFVGLRFKMVVLCWALLVAGIAWAWIKGINYGIDFAGGTMVHVKFAQATPIGDLRAALARPELHEVIVQDVGRSGQEFQIRVLGAEQG